MRLENGLPLIGAVSYRMRAVYLDHLDFRRCIKNWDGPTTFFFLDPPYYGATKYRTLGPQFTNQDHEDLAKILGHVERPRRLEAPTAAPVDHSKLQSEVIHMAENPPAPANSVVGNPKDIQGILALAIIIGYVAIAAAVIFTHLVTDPTAILTGLGTLAAAVSAFYFGVKSQQ
jgi:hypothetical protein